jgi:hypothetical protein
LALYLIEMLIGDSGGFMRQLFLLLSILALFVTAFTALYVSFRTSTQPVKGVVGGGFFLLVSLLMLWEGWRPKVSKYATSKCTTVAASAGLSEDRRDSCNAPSNQLA